MYSARILAVLPERVRQRFRFAKKFGHRIVAPIPQGTREYLILVLRRFSTSILARVYLHPCRRHRLSVETANTSSICPRPAFVLRRQM